MRIDNSQHTAFTPSETSKLKKTTATEVNHKIPQTVSTISSPQSQIPQLRNLLKQMNVLQRFFTTFIAHGTHTSATPPPVFTQAMAQLLMPENQAALIQWLRQGAGKQPLAQLLAQSNQPSSPLHQWLMQLTPELKEEFQAMLRLSAEQRLAPAHKETEQVVLQLPLLHPDGRESKLTIEKDAEQTRHGKPAPPRWTVRIALPVGEKDTVFATALWDQHKLSLGFECDNLQLLKRAQSLTPLLTERLTTMGIRCDTTQFKLRQPESPQPESKGLLIRV
ncbi:hypothetical protein [Photobacterium atrarenae]|uniref:Flagellar hook-length control protein-like C-terminal domain-containing protein n=1 Tax=Photobacterium atrarenae TaxID=865757 RepID=A0ABY5GCP5_9GAMM|nr:hypothetical protein [Photobacterium atrarenae]UTV27004.1 hypothetical protein NNL38_11705 [Photobacterium atrarenae]